MVQLDYDLEAKTLTLNITKNVYKVIDKVIVTISCNEEVGVAYLKKGDEVNGKSSTTEKKSRGAEPK